MDGLKFFGLFMSIIFSWRSRVSRCSFAYLTNGSENEILVLGAYAQKVRKRAKIRNRYDQVPYLTQDTNGKVTNSQLDITNESQEVSPFQAEDHKATKNRCARK